ncbi:tetratricopeptide repeat protein [Tenacibaculum sp. TC6]|uniref:tetratricopeptide repeat protein n=1 Tax=Tenacibaculum sp. TC6 TaxID=3423223 RepID=UPI003D3601B1
MKTNFFLLGFFFFLMGCNSKENSQDFISATQGRYYFNADETIEVYYTNNVLFLKWRQQNLQPLKVNDSTFYVRELNEKLIFKPQGAKIVLAPKREHQGEKYIFNKLKDGEKTPSEYLAANNYEMALKGYLAIKEKDSLNPVIKERSLNKLGYAYVRNNDIDKAIQVFKINTVLYPNSSNTYDSLGDGYLKNNDTVNAIDSYKKALSINPENNGSKRKLNQLMPK